MAKKDVIKVGLLGLGTVGYGVFKTLKLQENDMMAKLGSKIEIKRILVLKVADFADKVEDPSILTENADDILCDPEIDLVVELIGGTNAAYTFQKKALENGKHIVTANKDLVATKGYELIALAAANGLDYNYEAAVAGGIPVIRPLKMCLAGNHVTEILGIVNGTTNFILSKMANEGMGYEEALKIASDLGYAEANPTSDVEGLDAGRKVAIMGTLAFHRDIRFDDVYKEGITKLTEKDFASAKELGYTIKLIGMDRLVDDEVEVCVYPMLIPADHMLAKVDDAFNAVFIHGDAVDDIMLYGRGAGEMPTASAVTGDIFEVVRNINNGVTGKWDNSTYNNYRIRTIDEVCNKFFVRMTVKDTVGVLATVVGTLAEDQISIASIIQNLNDDNSAEIILTTEKVNEKSFRNSLDKLKASDVVEEISSVIRVY
ncbi:MAG: homoserine dehydrogenase [Lachnospiraceae bacterium]|nr:homoserine dehydrogenase [Lachnospiraceae bacterium]